MNEIRVIDNTNQNLISQCCMRVGIALVDWWKTLPRNNKTIVAALTAGVITYVTNPQ